ncbi:N-acetylmuramoyl-L-alanine amidase [Schaalia sp. lx-260]|uniref:N-acetylmuramoyl-L-alanine amidase n=1 Tax=Schaalia sp. lx-260 TaxID=2899082 RepID=UPI001E4C99AD|nr:N-acetylmuramoyl-L-alanine amidase [Schaalia sp. lx-260]MCD4549668.1 N-acetylmuramoyl-L-alanine amidase [Schaalia sp. lx-260]
MSSYEEITAYTSPAYTSGRPYGISCIVLHHWGDPATHPTFEGVVSYLTRASASTSAHYVAEAGRVACIVDPDNRAWHAGDGIGVGSAGNDKGIGIECNPRASEADVATIAALVADLRAVYGDLPIKVHSDFVPTQCPGAYRDLVGLIDGLARGTASSGTIPPRPEALAPIYAGDSIDALARRALAGDFGNGDERRAALGDAYDAVQARVNQLCGLGGPSQPAGVDAVARDVIAGAYGNGQERYEALRAAGYDPDAVQARVNEILGAAPDPAPSAGPDIEALARAVIRGEFGNGDERRAALGDAYDAVQARVNQLLS